MTGEARTSPAVLAQRIDDCQVREAEFRAANERDHADIFGRLGRVEIAVARQAVQIGIAAAVGGAAGSALLSYVLRLMGKG